MPAAQTSARRRPAADGTEEMTAAPNALDLAVAAGRSRAIRHATTGDRPKKGRAKAVRQKGPGVDGMTAATFRRGWPTIRHHVVGGLAGGYYQPEPVLPVVIRKAGRKPREGFANTLTDHAAAWMLAEGLGRCHLYAAQHPCVFAGTPGRSSLDAVQLLAREARRHPWYAGWDITNYFACIDRMATLDRLRHLTNDSAATAMVARFYDPGALVDGIVVPVPGFALGVSCSPVMSNFSMHHIDPALAELGAVFTRYYDDCGWLLDSRAQGEDALGKSAELALAEGFVMKPSSRQLVDLREAPATYLGWEIRPDRIDVSPAVLKRVAADLEDLIRRDRRGWRTDLSLRRAVNLMRGVIENFWFATNVKDLYDLARRAQAAWPDPEWDSVFSRMSGHLGSLRGVAL